MFRSPPYHPLRSPLYSPLVGKWGGGVTYSPQAQALFARFTTQPTSARKALIDALIVSLINAGVWAKLDALYMMAAADGQAARQNWVQNLYNLSAVNSPAFTADRGYAGDGSTSYLNTNFNPTTATSPNYTRDSAHLSVSDRTSRTTTSDLFIEIGANPSGVQSLIGTKYAGSNYSLLNTGSGYSGIANANSLGRYVGSRTNPTTVTGFKNGATSGAVGGASVAVPNANFFICGENNGSLNQGSPDQLSQAGFGAALTATDVGNFDAAISTYLTAVGA